MVVYGEQDILFEAKMILRVGRNLETMLQEVGHTDNANTVTIQQATMMNDQFLSPLGWAASNNHTTQIQYHSNVYRSTETSSQIFLPIDSERTEQLATSRPPQPTKQQPYTNVSLGESMMNSAKSQECKS